MTVEGSLAKDPAVYPRGLYRAMPHGVADQLKEDSLVKTGCFGIQVPHDDAAVEREIRGPAQGLSGRFIDDLTGQILHDATVIKARAVELTFFHSKGAWTKGPKKHARAKTGSSTYIRTVGGRQQGRRPPAQLQVTTRGQTFEGDRYVGEKLLRTSSTP